MSLTVEKKSYVRPEAGPEHRAPTIESIPLAGVDVMFNGMNVRLSILFDHVVSKQVLKASLAKALPAFPLLSTNVVKTSTGAFCKLTNKGPR